MARPSDLEPGTFPAQAAELRGRVREFLAETPFTPRCDSWLTGADPAFSRALGERGWLGMTLPERYGGHGRSPLERFAVIEELLAAGAPVGAHWIADRQTGPSILANGTEEQKARFLPAIARGECFFAIGMSEPDSGSDLASVRTRADREEGGWRLHGTKVWTSGAHIAQAILVLARTSPRSDDRHAGLSQFIVPLPDERVAVRPIRGLSGEHHFNEVVFDGAFVPDAMVLGRVGDGWRQVTAELAYERSGPERLLSTFLLVRLLHGRADGPAARRALGRLTARLWALRQASLAVAGALDAGPPPDAEAGGAPRDEGRHRTGRGLAGVENTAALVKDLGTRFEREVIETVREHADVEPDLASPDPLARALAESVVQAPGFTLRGGTNEILRGIVARGLGVR